MAAKTHATKQAVLDAIAALGGEARLIEIARALGPEWTVGPAYVRLRQTVRQMVRSSVLKTIRRGVYLVHPQFHRRGFDRRDHMVRAIIAYLEECCGVATTAAIHNAVGARDLTDGTRDDDHHRVTRALAETPEKFCQPYGSGIWALTEDARERLPLLGKWAPMELNPCDRGEFFERVGLAFAEARGEMKPEDVVAQPGIREALEDMANHAHGSKRLAADEIRKEVAAELAARGVKDEYAITLAAYDREDAVLLLDLYLRFERGEDSDLHQAAPPEFYRGAAALFGVDAARLSRGEVVKLVTPEGDFASPVLRSPP
jgi:hypothetical protein